MDIASKIRTALDVVGIIKEIFDQASQDGHTCESLSGELMSSLSKIQELLEHQGSSPQELNSSLSEIKVELNVINSLLQSLIEPASGGVSDRSLEDIRSKLSALRQKILSCYQQLQTTRLEYTKNEAMNMHEDLIVRLNEQETLKKLIPGLNLERKATLEKIEEDLSERLRSMEANRSLEEELSRIKSKNQSRGGPSIRRERHSARSLSSSIIQNLHLLKEILNTILQVRDYIFRQSAITWFNQFRKMENINSSMSVDEAIRETIRILKVLRSGKKIKHFNAAKYLLRLGLALRRLDMLDCASVIDEWVVQICCELATSRNPKTTIKLARLLRELISSLDSNEQIHDAWRVLEQAVEIGSRLPQQDQNTYVDTLAPCLQKILRRSWTIARFDAWSKAEKQVVGMLVKDSRRTYLSGFAKALHNFAIDLNRTGKPNVAIKVATKVIEMRRELLEMDREIFLSDLSSSVHNLAYYLNRVGRSETAMEVVKEAITMRRELIKQDRILHLPGLSLSLHQLAHYLDGTGRPTDAVEVVEEALKLHRELVKNSRDHLPNLSSSLHSLASYLDKTGKSESAVKMVEEAVEIRRGLVLGDRKTHLPNLSSSVHQLAYYLDKTGRSENAVKVAEESIDMRRELVKEDRMAHLHSLSLSLHQLAYYLDRTGRPEDAVKVVTEAISLYQELVKKDGKAHLPDLSHSVYRLACYFWKTGRSKDALNQLEEAIKIREEFVAKDRGAHLPKLSLYMHEMASHLDKEGRSEDAVNAGREAVKMRQELANKDAKTHLPDLILSLENLAKLLHKTRRSDDAKIVEEELSMIRQKQRESGLDS